ncbi:MAG: efflux RND transporter periplasmic adaptor subunit [Spirochaetaceae bacterium]|nr:efflux RND transporter periplasmic adaptor subunit [Spirochaetaceae bacterium]MDT8297182.1 efflux RND transporter periplasmic adaptor subunit [Spirochaetaceae bacterium]
MNNVPRRLLQASLLLLLIGSVMTFFLLNRAGDEERETPPAAPVRVVRPVERRMEETVKAYGTVKSANQVTLLPKVSGAVTEMYADVGDIVDEGSLLAVIDREAYEWDLKRAEAAYASVSSTWERVNRLYDAGNVTRQSWEDARAAHAAAEARAAAAGLRYDWTRLVSPVEGAVLVKHVNIGSLVAPEAVTPVFTIGSLEDLELELHLPDSRYPSFVSKVPQARAVVDSIPSLKPHLIIKSVAPWVDPTTRSFTVVCRVVPDAESRALLRPGMFVTVEFILSVKERALTLPDSALTGGRWVWMVDSQGRARRLEVPSPFISGGVVEVPRDWASNRFIIEGQHFLTEGTLLRILDGDKP